ncbi:surf-like protein [Mitosporidium daphniae]
MARRDRLLFVLPVTFAILGTWQLCRHYEKKEKYDRLNRALATDCDPVLVDRKSKLQGLTEGEPVILHGYFALTPVPGYYDIAFLGPRISPQESTNPGLGYHIIKPFRLSFDASPILLNLGWVSRELFLTETVATDGSFHSSKYGTDLASRLGLNDGKLRSLLAIVTEKDEKVLPEWYGPVQKKTDIFFFYSQKKELGDALGLASEQPFLFKVIDSDESSPLMVPNSTEPARIVPHLQYMATWFACVLIHRYVLAVLTGAACLCL